MSTPVSVAGTVSTAVVRSLIAHARKHSQQRVIGIRAVPDESAERRFADDGESVHVLPCISSLAIRQALRVRAPEEWLIILTDRPAEDLGAGILAHFVSQRLQSPGVWDALNDRFGADRIDRNLANLKKRMAVAQGLLRITPDSGWPAAPGGVLTLDHAFGAVARRQLMLAAGPLDSFSVLEWTNRSDAAARVADLGEFGGRELAEATLEWLTSQAGPAELPLRRLLEQGHFADALPLAFVLHVVTTDRGRSAEEKARTELALARLEYLWAGAGEQITHDMLIALGQTAQSVIEAQLDAPARWQEALNTLHAADKVLAKIQATNLSIGSKLLPTGLTAALQHLADSLLTFPSTDVGTIEGAWAQVEEHRLAYPLRGEPDPRVAPFHAAVRLSRWLDSDEAVPSTFAEAVRLQAREDAWVDVAYNDAAAGVDDESMGKGLDRILGLTQEKRRTHDRTFAQLLAASTSTDEGHSAGHLAGEGDAVWHLERLLPAIVIPLARKTKTLLLVLDGMSAASAAELTQNVLRRNEGWVEAIPVSSQKRGAAVAVLPTLTTLSRASLFSGELTTGGQAREQSGFAAVAKTGGIAQAVLFHKAPLDSSRPGLSLQDDIATAIADSQTELVACVLNTIDDALDKSDPAGTTWTPETIRHLRPLLSQAMAAGRMVVMTSDHGHIVERRHGQMRSWDGTTSARSRSVEGAAAEDEVLVQGRRVLAEDSQAILAVDETLRYGSIKAGYHGGGSPAEVVVPVVVLAPSTDLPAGWKEAPLQEPLWWSVAAAEAGVLNAVPHSGLVATGKGNTASLFGELDDQTTSDTVAKIGASVIASATYMAQKKIAGRLALDDGQVALLLNALSAAAATRLTKEASAVVLQVPPTRVTGAIAQLQKLLNVEGYGVLRMDGAQLVLDVPMLREQFGVTGNG